VLSFLFPLWVEERGISLRAHKLATTVFAFFVVLTAPTLVASSTFVVYATFTGVYLPRPVTFQRRYSRARSPSLLTPCPPFSQRSAEDRISAVYLGAVSALDSPARWAEDVRHEGEG
jgi:hypothetical protein